jgi:AraC-like DNA-binding protein
MKNEPYISKRITVPKQFTDVFTHFYYAKNNGREAIHKTLLPNFQTILVFNFGPPAGLMANGQITITVDSCILLGPVKQPLQYMLPAGTEILVANFKADAFYRFFGRSLTEAQHPDAFIGDNCFTGLQHVLQPISSPEERVNQILSFCLPYLRERDKNFEAIANTSDNSLNTIKVIAEQSNLTERAVQLQHKKYLGYSAKEINRYHRFLKALELLQGFATSGTKPDWFEIVHECNYYDQSQLIHDFKHYMHLSPTQYLQFQEAICIAKNP